MVAKILYSANDFELAPLIESDEQSLSNFSCGVDEIDEFFHSEVFLCAKYKYLMPYKCILKSSGEIAGVFTLANDTIKLEYEDIVQFPNLASEYIDIFNRQCTYPAINIGHLAVRSELQSSGIGKFIVEFVRMTFTNYRGAGCQFITVDALNNYRTINFYTQKLGFEFQTLSDLGKHTRRMYLEIFSIPS